MLVSKSVYLRISPYLLSKGEGDGWKILGGSHSFQGGTEGNRGESVVANRAFVKHNCQLTANNTRIQEILPSHMGDP